jgi:hypothetical protein
MLNVAESGLAIGRLRCLSRSCFGISTLDVKKRTWCLGVAEGNLAKRTFHNERLVLRTSFGGLYSACDLLLHALNMVISASWMMTTTSIAIAAASLEEVGLSKLVQWLARSTARWASDLSIHLVVEVLSELLLATRLIVNTTRGGQ